MPEDMGEVLGRTSGRSAFRKTHRTGEIPPGLGAEANPPPNEAVFGAMDLGEKRKLKDLKKKESELKRKDLQSK
ncbi:uncharacterized protein A4U43_C10F14620 [Asparagus officinalis]|uniref:Uncharacterized protein n=1 Tax=Asparagus officinalis TaxID=4686 RepID=A0A5P1E315_ASPOF|nr:uncharacterized protein A4U43_C10F14620 [Asparagus officinalis]